VDEPLRLVQSELIERLDPVAVVGGVLPTLLMLPVLLLLTLLVVPVLLLADGTLIPFCERN